MAGDNQHFIPQFAQAGFASRGTAHKRKTWVYRRTRDPFESNIRNVNAEHFFYGTATDRGLDDEITKLEGQALAPLWQSLVEMAPGPVDDASSIARLVAHFETRTKHIRVLLEAPVNTLFDRIAREFEDKEALTKRLITWIRADPLHFIGDAEQAKLGGRAFAIATIKGMSRKRLEPIVRPIVESAGVQLKLLRAVTDVPALMKRGHNNALLKSFGPSARVDTYETAHFRVVEYAVSDPPLVLGDSVCAFAVKGEEYRPLQDGPNAFRQVILPLAPGRALVGSLDPKAPIPKALQVRLAAIRCSRDQFIAAARQPDIEAAVGEIGIWSAMLGEAEVQGITADVIRNMFCRSEGGAGGGE